MIFRSNEPLPLFLLSCEYILFISVFWSNFPLSSYKFTNLPARLGSEIVYSDARITTKHTDIQCILTLNRVLITFVTKQESVAICCMTTGEEKQQCISGESLPHSYLCFVLWQNICRGYRTRRNSYNFLFNQQINNIIGNASNFS